MRISTVAAALAVSAIVTIPLAGIASAGGDRNCSEFGSQAEAQKALDGGTGSTSLLDPDGDGVACKTSKDKDDDKKKKPDSDKADESDKSDSDNGDGSDDGDDKSKKSDDDKQVSVVPKGSVDTGDGSSGPGRTPAALALAGTAAIGVGAAGVRRAVRASR
jgi:Excalibur calcium-binding domain